MSIRCGVAEAPGRWRAPGAITDESGRDCGPARTAPSGSPALPTGSPTMATRRKSASMYQRPRAGRGWGISATSTPDESRPPPLPRRVRRVGHGRRHRPRRVRSGGRCLSGTSSTGPAARLAHYKCPRSVTFVDSLPRSVAGKMMKHRLIEQLAPAEPAAGRAHAPNAAGPRARRQARDDHGGIRLALSYAELDRQSNKIAQLFRSRGLRPGDHIAVLMENQP